MQLNATPSELSDLSDMLNTMSADVLCATYAPLSPLREFMLRQQLALLGRWCCDVAGNVPSLVVSPEHITEVSDAGLIA